MTNPNNVTHGTVNGVPVVVDVTRLDHSVAVHVQLTAAYSIIQTPGIPRRPQFTGASQANAEYPRTIPSGTKLYLLAGEAQALIAAGAASLLSTERLGVSFDVPPESQSSLEDVMQPAAEPVDANAETPAKPIRKRRQFPKSDEAP